jgi:hypothetical protein
MQMKWQQSGHGVDWGVNQGVRVRHLLDARSRIALEDAGQDGVLSAPRTDLTGAVDDHRRRFDYRICWQVIGGGSHGDSSSSHVIMRSTVLIINSF